MSQHTWGWETDPRRDGPAETQAPAEYGLLSPERYGRITASRMEAALSCSPSYIAQLIGERNGQRPPETGRRSGVAALDWGRTQEPACRAAYELATGQEVLPCGFVVHRALDFVGATCDGFVGDDGAVEFKCPEDPARHLWCWSNGRYWPKDRAQVQAELWITGRAWLDYVSFDPRQGHPMDYWSERVVPDRTYHAVIEAACRRLWAFVLAERVPETVEVDPANVPKFF